MGKLNTSQECFKSRWKPAWAKRSHKQLLNSLLTLVYPLLLLLVLLSLICDETRPSLDALERCAIDNFHRNLSFLEGVQPISVNEFLERRHRLAQALKNERVDAFVIEPGYAFQYYANISQKNWEPWEPEERPFLMVVQPRVHKFSGEVVAKTTFLSPAFEAGRVRMLGIPASDELDIITWEEEENPYKILKNHLVPRQECEFTLMIDEEMRDFIVRGLSSVGFKTVGLAGDVEAVRQTKTQAEIDILRAVNTGTIEAIRAMRECLEPGLTENEVMQILHRTMQSIGFEPFFDIVLFDSNAALPHGGFKTGDKVLKDETMVLIDVGSHYLGYSSDVCRSFFIPRKKAMFFSIFGLLTGEARNALNMTEIREKTEVWNIVFEAQTAAASMMKSNNTAASVDIAARKIIDDAGYRGTFTHRLGHGIGIKAHESPYLNKGNFGVKLRPNMTFTAEPGIYLEGRFGVRHEDIFLVTENGEAEVISGKRAVSPYQP